MKLAHMQLHVDAALSRIRCSVLNFSFSLISFLNNTLRQHSGNSLAVALCLFALHIKFKTTSCFFSLLYRFFFPPKSHHALHSSFDHSLYYYRTHHTFLCSSVIVCAFLLSMYCICKPKTIDITFFPFPFSLCFQKFPTPKKWRTEPNFPPRESTPPHSIHC